MATFLPQRPDNTTYTFASQPRALRTTPRKKYRDPVIPTNTDGAINYGNIMYDRRVVRGNTYALQTLPAHSQLDPIEIQRRRENRRRAIARQRAKEQFQAKAPDAVEGRRHVAVQTDLYLEELTDNVEEFDQDCQTDAFLDRPPSPLFVPAKSGLDVETQIYGNDLFNFDLEVKPILEVIVGKTIEQSLLEVMEEEELANLRTQQREFEELRNAELVEQQRLEEQERRHREEKERRMKQQTEMLKKEKETAEKIAARAYARSYLRDLVPSVFGTLTEQGYFFDDIERDVEGHFVDWLSDQAVEHLDREERGRLALDGLLREVVCQRADTYFKLEQALLSAAIQYSVNAEKTATADTQPSVPALETEEAKDKTDGEEQPLTEQAEDLPDTEDPKPAGTEEEPAVADE